MKKILLILVILCSLASEKNLYAEENLFSITHTGVIKETFNMFINYGWLNPYIQPPYPKPWGVEVSVNDFFTISEADYNHMSESDILAIEQQRVTAYTREHYDPSWNGPNELFPKSTKHQIIFEGIVSGIDKNGFPFNVGPDTPFRDALYFTLAEYPNVTRDEITAEELSRINNFATNVWGGSQNNGGTTVTPEPASMLLFGLGGAALAWKKRKTRSVK